MPRNGSGTYSLPSGNPVVTGTVIDATWANDTLEDIANELTNSLSRTGAGGMLAPFRIADGSVTSPGLAFLNETNTGLYRAGSGEIWLAVGGVAVAQITGNGVLIPSGKRLSLPAPVSDADAATKEYVDDRVDPVIQYAQYYLGPKAADPTLDNDGNPLVEGASYWSTSLNQLRFYNGSNWVPSPSISSLVGQTFSGDALETDFTLANPTGDAINLEVFISGVRQVPTTDYTVSGTTLTFTVAPPVGTDNIFVRYAQLGTITEGAADIVYTPAGTGAVATTVQTKLRETVSVKDFGAVGDGVTDDTAAIQAAINSLSADGELVFPKGTFQVTQLVIPTGIQIRGAGSGITYIRQVSGQTVPLLIDNTSGQNILIYDISFDGNNNTIVDGIVNLGFNGVQFGTVAMIKNVYIRNVVGTGLKVNANVAQFDTIEAVNCTIGVNINGPSNLIRNIITANCTDIGLNIKGARNMVDGVYGEGQCSTAVLNVENDSQGTAISNVSITGIGANIHGAGIKLGTSCFLTTITGVTASVTSSANLANGLIYDLTTGTRKVYGENYAGVFFNVPSYFSGARAELHFIGSVPPTIGTYLAGDWFQGVGASAGFPVSWKCVAAGTPGVWEPHGVQSGAIAKTADETLTSADNGKRFSNNGAAALVTLTIPASTAGQKWHFVRRNSTYALRVEPGGSFLAGAGFGKYVQLDTDGASITIEYLSSGTYVISSQSGTVSYEP